MAFTVWTNVDLFAEDEARIRSAIGPNELILGTATPAIAPGIDSDPACRFATVAFGQPPLEDLMESTSLKWIHLSSAGYTRYDRSDLKETLRARGAMLTNSSTVYDDPCAQQVLGYMLAHNRSFFSAFKSLENESWDHSVHRPTQRVLTRQSALIVGYGAIGVRLTELLAPFKMNLKGVRRKVTHRESIPTFPIEEIKEHIGGVDHVIDLLPASPSTEKLFNRELFSLMKPGAAFYNVGRGDTVDQDDLMSFLGDGHLGGAYLDVTTPEPLPKEHPLWTAPRCYITPHVAGGMQDEGKRVLDHFLANYEKFALRKPLADRIV
jgi:phosphoglycerate dehydrogenase-like enzyme